MKDGSIKVRVGGSVSQSKQADLGIPHRGVLSVTLFLVAINGILGELGNEVDRSHFVDDLEIYITTRNQRVAARAPAESDQQAGCMGSGEGLHILPQQNSKHGIKKEK